MQMRVPADVARRISPVGSSFTVSMEPEQLGLAVQAVLAALAWLPARKYVEQAVVRLSERGAFTALSGSGEVAAIYPGVMLRLFAFTAIAGRSPLQPPRV